MALRRSRARRQLLAGLAAVLTLVALIVLAIISFSSHPAQARRGLFASWFQDDQYLLYGSRATAARTLDVLKALGVDDIRVTILWKAIAPQATLRARPARFDASSPAAYPARAWARYDAIVRLARARGIGVDFNLTAPGPLWAMRAKRGAPAPRFADHYAPSARDFTQFVAAVGRRYSGRYVPGSAARGRPLPRVRLWSIWNEPNQPGWLAPQWRVAPGGALMVSPKLYRSYVDGAFSALLRTGHGPATDTILIGELAPEGRAGTRPEDPMAPLPFLRALYCVDAAYRPLSGRYAVALGCPRTPSRASFVAAHSGLFESSGLAHHPYSFFLAPGVGMSDPDFVPLADLSRLEHAIDAIFRAYGVKRALPLYLTEYGYETNPPNPFRGVSPRLQSLYLNQAQYIASRDPRVRALSQFLLYDSQPDRKFAPGSPRYWSTFQTGLLYANGVRKFAFNSYRLPIFVPAPVLRPGKPVVIWGMLRLAPNYRRQAAQIQWRPRAGAYRTLMSAVTDDPSGFMTVRVQLPGPGAVRISWVSPAGVVFHSRAVGIS